MFNFLDAFPRISGRFLWKHTDQRADKEQEGDELATFLSLPTAKAIADEIERLGDCSPTSPSKRSLMDTGLECSVVQFMLANTPQNSLPGHLLRLLARRLSFACKELADIELLEFSQTSAQVLDMLIAANPIKNGSILLDSGLESALLQILKLLGRALGTQSVHGTGTVGVTPKASAQAKLRNRGASSPRGDSTRMLLDVSEAYNENGEQARSFSLRSKLLETFHTLLRLLMTLYVGRPGSRSKLAASSKLGSYGSEEEQIVDEVNATGIPNSLLAKGWSRSQPGSLYVFLQQNSSTVDAISMSARDNILRGLPVREAMVVECAHLFVHFTEGAFCAALTSGEFDPAVCSEIVCSLALVMLHLYKKATSEIVRASLTGIGAQFARLVGCTTRGKKELTLIRELSCSLLLVAKLLRESCALTTELMDSMQFFSRLVGALQVVGNLFEAPHGDREYMQARECCISGLHELEVMISSRSYENTPEMLEFHRPRFERLAEERSVDEFLHCYMGLLETQRDVKATEEGRQSSVTLRYLTEIELSPLKSLMDLESAQLTTSCAYTLLLKCAIGLLPGIETRVFVPSRLRSMHSLVNAGLYSVLFCGRDTDPFHTDSFLRYNALFILHSMLTLPSALPAAESDFDCSSSEVCTLLDVLLNDGKGQTNESIDCQECESGSVRSHLPSMMCLVLLSAVRSPCGGAVVATFLKNDGILALTRVAEKHFLCNEGKCMDRRSEGLSMLAMHLLTVLVMNPVVQESVLVREAKVFISFLKVKSIRVRAEEAFVSLLTHSCPRTEHTRRMKLLVHSARALLKECLKSNLVEGLCKEESEEVIISILRCVCTALRTLFREGLFGPVRLLQNVLCAGENGALDSFFPPLECVSVSWCSVSSTFALSCVASTISLLIQGNSSTRALLFSSISPHELVVSFKAAWFTSQDASWMGFVRCILSVVYEDGDGDADSAGDGEDVGKLKEARGDNVSTAHEDGSCATAFLSSDSLLSTERTSAPYMIQNAELLLQLLHLFTSESEFNEERHNVLDYVLLRIVRTLHISRASLWLVASAGIFEALTALIPLVYSTPLLGKVSELMMEVASHHISVRETKQFLMSIAHARSEEERQMLTLIVIEVLSSASRSLLSRKFEQQNYVAFREGSGPVGLKVVLSDFPLDGYTVCMWLRLESRAIHVSQCIFSLQDTSNRSVLKLSVTKGNILLTFMDARGETVTADLVCSIVPQAWTHVAVVHWDTRFPFTKQGFCLFIDGEQVRRMESVQYPRLGGGFFHVGTCGEDVDHGLCAGNLVGQVAAVHFFCRTLSERMIMDLFREKSGASSVREECSDTVAVYIDPRFGEGGRLHNLAGLPRGKPLQRPLITYEGTLACNAKSIVDSICVLGALQTVVVPLLVLLVNPQLPFQCRVPVARRRAVPEATCKAINDLLKLVEFLLISNIVRADVLEVGLFPMVAHVIQQFISYHCTKLPQRLCNLCIALIPESTLFDAAYSTLFLCGDLLHCLSEAAQLLMVQVQYDACEARADVRHRVRGLDVPHFIVSEIVYTYNGASAHDVEMRLGMFRLLETVMLDVVTRSDAEALKRLVDAVLQQERVGVMGKEVCTDVSLQVEILEHVRILVANRDPLLAALLGKNDFIATLVPFLSDTHHEVRNEVLLLFILVVSRSRRVQELLTPALVSKHEAIHVVRDVSLSWLHDKLRHLTGMKPSTEHYLPH
ncbi:putative Concanavalin A like lectin glucanases superfamily [Trypanosoma vivax]|nr:putative Concanavalin A like lectin glucanases superfamily [Trypanosoma vivax]